MVVYLWEILINSDLVEAAPLLEGAAHIPPDPLLLSFLLFLVRRLEGLNVLLVDLSQEMLLQLAFERNIDVLHIVGLRSDVLHEFLLRFFHIRAWDVGFVQVLVLQVEQGLHVVPVVPEYRTVCFHKLIEVLDFGLDPFDDAFIVVDLALGVLLNAPRSLVGLDERLVVIILSGPVVELDEGDVLEHLCLHRRPLAGQRDHAVDGGTELRLLGLDKREAVLVVAAAPLGLALLLCELLARLELVDLKDVQLAEVAEVFPLGLRRVEVRLLDGLLVDELLELACLVEVHFYKL